MSSKEVNQSSSIEQDTIKPWYKNRWPWFLIAGPAIVVVGCIITIYLAFTQSRDTPLVNQQNRQGLVTTRSQTVGDLNFLPPVDRPIPEHLREQFKKDKDQ